MPVTAAPSLDALLAAAQSGYLTFEPRPDQPDRWDRQTSFVNSRHRGLTFLLGGNGAGTTTCAVFKAVKFLMEQAAPRVDTPFLVVGPNLDLITTVVWKEKMVSLGLMPSSEVQWERIVWHSEKNGLPRTVPLKRRHDRPHGGNWMLQFLSSEQGRGAFQGISAGGFLFVEQFPWEILIEANTRSREYSYPGSRIIEMTPVDPSLSYPLEQMLTNNTLPSSWGVYHANTEVAMEAGHVSKEWYDDWVAGLSDEMREVRTRGAFASFEGSVYKRWNPSTHVVGDARVFPRGTFPPGVSHRRAIDWGAGPNNAFVCLWAYQESCGRWVVYDEYYSKDQGLTTTNHLEIVYDRWEWPNTACYGTTWVDPASAGGRKDAMQLHVERPGKMFRSLSPANNDVDQGIEQVKRALSTFIDGEPSLLIHESCKQLVRQMRTYKYMVQSSHENTRGARGVPLKRDDDAVDALRYLIHSEAGMTGQTVEMLSHRHSRTDLGLL